MTSFFTQNISWLFTVLSLVGNIFVIKKNKWGQVIWAISNVGWIWYNFSIKEYAAVVLFTAYFILCLWGIYEWSKKEILASKKKCSK